jgi:hypothetical protein
MQNRKFALAPHSQCTSLRPWQSLKGIHINNVYAATYILYSMALKKLISIRCHVHSVRISFIHYLSEIETEFNMALAHEAGSQGLLSDIKKTRGHSRKSRDTVP